MTTLEFLYRKHHNALYPTIPVHLSRMSKTLDTDALIDSGSNYCIFKPEIAEVLGAPFRGKEIKLSTVSGEIPCYMHNIEIQIPGFDKPFACEAGFSRQIKTSFNLLGRIGFFEKYLVTFREKEKKVVLSELE